jgi:hypothetical protein
MGMDDSEVAAAMDVAIAYCYRRSLNIAIHSIPPEGLFDIN